jgi:hypothetical protein
MLKQSASGACGADNKQWRFDARIEHSWARLGELFQPHQPVDDTLYPPLGRRGDGGVAARGSHRLGGEHMEAFPLDGMGRAKAD